MLQRQIMFKQLQELQRRQQLQGLGDARNQDYANQLSSIKPGSPVQFAPTGNGELLHDSQMLTVGNLQMMQHSGTSVYQGFPNSSVLQQSHNHGLVSMGLSMPQFDVSLYGPSPPNMDKNLNHYSANLLAKNNNSPLGISPMHPSSFTSQQGNFSSDQVSTPDGSFLPNQVFQEKNLFGQVPIQSLNNDLSSVNYSQQGVTLQRNTSVLESEGRHDDTGQHGISPGQQSATLDPLEQKILFNSDDNCWDSSFGGSSWSALMQSAVAETSSGDTAIQEEWSGLSFQNPEPSTDNQPSNFINNSEKPQNNWVDRNLQNVSSPSSEPPEQLFQKSNMNYNFPGFQHSGQQYLEQKDEFQAEHSPRNTSQFVEYNYQQKRPTGGSQLVQTSLPSPHAWPAQYKETFKNDADQPNNNFSGYESRTSWLHGSASTSVPGGIQKPFDQVNEPNMHRYSVKSDKMAPGESVEPMPALIGTSSELHGQNLTSQSKMFELLNKDDISNNQTPGMQMNSKASSSPKQLPLTGTSVASFAQPFSNNPGSQGFGFRLGPADAGIRQPFSFYPSLSMGNSSTTSLSSHHVNDYIRKEHLASPAPSQMTNKFPAYGTASSQVNFPSSGTGKSSPWPNMTTQQDVSSPKPYKFSSNMFQSPDSACSSLETNSAVPNEQPNQNLFKHEQEFGTISGKPGHHEQLQEKESSPHEGSTQMYNPTSLSRTTHTLEEQRDVRAFGQSMHQSHSPRHPLHSSRIAETDSANYQQAIANARELLLSGQKPAVKDKPKSDLEPVQPDAFSSMDSKGLNFSQEAQEDQSGKASAAAYLQNFQQMELFGQNNTGASKLAYQPQISMQMAPSWFKHYGTTLKNGQVLPMYNPKAAVNAAEPLSGLSIANLQENNLIRQQTSNQGNVVWPSSAATLMASKQLSPSIVLPSDAMNQNLIVSKSKKRKIVAFDMVPWHKEVNQEKLELPNISMAELEWAEALKRIPEEAKTEAEAIDDVVPIIRAKRRLIFTTQLMQQVFRPAPAVILFADASLSCDNLAYSAARLTLGDACNLTNKLPADSNDVSSEKPKTLKRTSSSEFSKVVEGFTNRVKKLEGDLTRMDKSVSIVDIKVEIQDLEKFSTINRFAKFHIRANPGTTDPASSSGQSSVPKAIPQRYVVGHPMPQTVPEGIDCLSL